MAFIGVRISCDMLARKALLARLAASAATQRSSASRSASGSGALASAARSASASASAVVHARGVRSSTATTLRRRLKGSWSDANAALRADGAARAHAAKRGSERRSKTRAMPSTTSKSPPWSPAWGAAAVPSPHDESLAVPAPSTRAQIAIGAPSTRDARRTIRSPEADSPVGRCIQDSSIVGGPLYWRAPG
jgi:hypothetical protein